MARKRRQWISQTAGSFHIISRTTGGDILLHDEEKEYFLQLLECFTAGYFVAIHSFAILGNHFHIQATGLNLEAEKATPQELLRRYRLMFGDDQEPPHPPVPAVPASLSRMKTPESNVYATGWARFRGLSRS